VRDQSSAVRRFDRSEHRFLSALGVAEILAWGALFYTFPVLAPAMAAEFATTPAALYSAVSIGLVVSSLASYPVGALIDDGRGRIVMAGGGVLAGVGLFLWSLAPSPTALALVFGVIGLACAATLYEPTFAIATRRLGPLARRGITTLALWGGFASTVAVPAVQVLEQAVGWRQTLTVLAVVVGVGVTVLPLLVINPARDHPVAAAPDRGGSVLRALAVRPVFWALTLAFACYSLSMTGFIVHFYPFLIERGVTGGDAALVFAVVGPAQVAARIVLWRAADRVSASTLGRIAFVGFCLAIAAFWWLPTYTWLLAATAGLYGVANGAMTVVRGAVVVEMLGHQRFGRINGAVMTPALAAIAAAPWLAGLAWSSETGYDRALGAGLALGLAATGSFLAAGFWHRRDQANLLAKVPGPPA
jgi:predicted MFS family arabinose efflux permease